MKLILCNGQELSVYDVGDKPLLTLKTRDTKVPIKYDGSLMVEDDEARGVVKGLLGLDLYDRL